MLVFCDTNDNLIFVQTSRHYAELKCKLNLPMLVLREVHHFHPGVMTSY